MDPAILCHIYAPTSSSYIIIEHYTHISKSKVFAYVHIADGVEAPNIS